MIGYLNGKLLSFNESDVLLEVNGVGFEISCSASACRKLVTDGGGEVFVYTAVKEDGISLYGFISPEEKKAFLSLISVNGVGPKTGIAALSQMSLNALNAAIASSDVKTLSSVKGMGKKTAERVILELREKVDVSGTEFASPAVSAVADADAVLALIGLGFTKSESENAVIAAQKNGADTTQKIIASALKNMR